MGFQEMVTFEDLEKRVNENGEKTMRYVEDHIASEDPLAKYFPFQNSGNSVLCNGQDCAGVVGVAQSARILTTENDIPTPKTCVDEFVYGLTNDDLEKHDDLISHYNSAKKFFAQAQLWKRLTALLAGAGKTIAASGTWNTVDAETNIFEAIAHLEDYKWEKSWGKILVIYPARVGMGLNQTRGIIKQSYPEVEFIPYASFRGADDRLTIDILGGASSDALTTNALIVPAASASIIECKSYSFERTPSVVTKQISDIGWSIILKRMNTVKVKPWKSTSDSSTTNPFIVKITGAAPVRA
jgi:hypothetical protein